MTAPATNEAADVVFPELTRPAFGALGDEFLEQIFVSRAITSHSLLWQFRVYKGLTPLHGYRVLKRLVDAKLVQAKAISPKLGKASHRMLQLTLAGNLSKGKHRKPTAANNPRALCRCQLAQVTIDYKAAGWGVLASASVWPYLVKAARAAVAGRILNSSERQDLEALRRYPPCDIGLAAFLSPTGDVRLILPDHHGKSLRRTLSRTEGEALAVVSKFCPLRIVVVSPDASRDKRVAKVLQQWAKPSREQLQAARRKGLNQLRVRRSTNIILCSHSRFPSFLGVPHPKELGGLTPSQAIKRRHAMVTRWAPSV